MNKAHSLVKSVVRSIIEDPSIRLFIDQNKEAHISVTSDGRKVYDVDSQEAQDWLAGYVMDNFDNEVLLRDQPKNILETLRGFAKHRGETKRLELRTTFDGEGNLWYDLGEYAVCITPNGWKIDACPPILFARNYTQEPQMLPVTGGTIWELFDYINVKDVHDRLLLIAFLTAALVPEINKPILTLSGPAGSGKSECTKTLKSLMDPTTPPSLPPITSVEELDKLAQTSAVMAFDNLTTMNAKIANHFCCLATGYGVRIRKLYTQRYIIFNAVRPLIINGISQVITQSDLLNRAIPVELSPIEKRVEDSELHKKFSEARPRILGAMFDLLSKAMKIYPTIERTEWPRMGSFAKWGYAIAAALGGDYTGETFMEAFKKVEALQHSEALSANPFAEVVTWFMHERETWVGTAGELLEELEDASQNGSSIPDIKYCFQSPYWPSNPRSARVQIQKTLADLKSANIIAFLPSGSGRTIYLINANLPISKALRSALDNPSSNGYSYTEQGYTLNDLEQYCAGIVSAEYVESSEDGELVLKKEVLAGKVIPKIIAGDVADTPSASGMTDFIEHLVEHDLPKTKKRLEIEAKQREEQEKARVARLEEQRKCEDNDKKRQEREQKEREQKEANIKAKQEKYIADCESHGMPIDKEYLDYIEAGGLLGILPF